MKNEAQTLFRPSLLILILLILEMALLPAFSADPQIDSWFTAESGKYARVYRTTADQLAGRTSATWGGNGNGQALPAYNGVQEVDSSADWVYARSSGLGIHVMGPWYLDPQKTQLFPNSPVNTKTLYRISRHPTAPAEKTLTGLGPIGIFVDGVAMYDGRDAFAWNGTSEAGGPGGGGYWNRDAYVNEWPSFDPSNAHQDQSGTYHYHANPPGLRHLLGDNVLEDPATKTFHENTANAHPRHSPILGWVSDGYPIYGPYGFSDPMNPASGVRRMTSGFVLRDGKNGADNLVATGRASLPAWAVRFYHVAANQPGPAVSQRYPLGRYMEDHEYLGDLGKKQGADFDLDESNGRFCVTPEFPNGTYAYFVAIDANGTPVFPYNIGRAFHGNPTGGSGTGLPETVVTNFIGGPDVPAAATPIAKTTNNTVTLVWSSVEGGSYQAETSADSANWTDKASVASQGLSTKASLPAGADQNYRVVRTSLAQYDPVTTTGVARGGRRVGPGGRGGREGRGPGGQRRGPGGNGVMVEGITSVAPNFGAPGQSVTVTINLNENAEPPLPPAEIPVAGVIVGGIKASNVRRSGNRVQATLSIPANASTGAQTMTLAFPPPPFDPSANLSYTLTNAFNIR